MVISRLIGHVILFGLLCLPAWAQPNPYQDLFSMLDEVQGALGPEDFLYQSYVQSGERLIQRCSSLSAPQYPDIWKQQQALLTVVSSVQALGVNKVIQQMGATAYSMELSHDAYQKLVHNLVDNYCSDNFTLMSKQRLKRSMLEQYVVVDPESNPGILASELYDQRSFHWAMQLFKGLCSWGNDPYDFRALTPILKDPFIMAAAFRAMQAQSSHWDPVSKKVQTELNENFGTRTLCHHRLCRAVPWQAFKQHFPMALGHFELSQGLEAIYCHNLKNATWQRPNQAAPLQIYNSIMSTNREQSEALYRSHFSALMADMPNFSLTERSGNQMMGALKENYEKVWDQWSRKALGLLAPQLYYEEALTLELIDRKFYFDKNKYHFSAVIDVNMGELDRSIQGMGKLSSRFNIPLSYSLLSWAQRQARQGIASAIIIPQLALPIKQQLEALSLTLPFARYPEGLEVLIAQELIGQLSLVEGAWPFAATGSYQLSVELNFAPFALRYLYHQNQKGLGAF